VTEEMGLQTCGILDSQTCDTADANSDSRWRRFYLSSTTKEQRELWLTTQTKTKSNPFLVTFL